MRGVIAAALVGGCCMAAGITDLAQATTLGRSARDAALRRAEPAAPARPARVDLDDRNAASIDYLLHCSGCHGTEGTGNRLGRIPALADRIGAFLQLPSGRAFLVQVPGVNGAGLDDATITRLMNWLIPRFAGATLPPVFKPYEPAEVTQARAQRPADISARRRQVVRDLADAGHPIDY